MTSLRTEPSGLLRNRLRTGPYHQAIRGATERTSRMGRGRSGAHPGRTPGTRHVGDALSPPLALLSDPHGSRVVASDGAAPRRPIVLAFLRAVPPGIRTRPCCNGTAEHSATEQTARERDPRYGDTRELPEVAR
jgi:hypothetical protein